MALYLCVDCGGTKTSAVITDAHGTIVGRAPGGPSNLTYLTLEAFIAAVTEAVGNALKMAFSSHSQDPVALPPLGPSPFAAAWFGVSGADSPVAIANITPSLSTLLGIPIGPNLIVANDTHLLAAPVRTHPDVTTAVAVIAGTGSIAVSFKEADKKIEELGRVGGWGWVLGDEGGGFHVGREAIRQILMEEDQASVTAARPPASKLRDRVLQRFGVTNVMEILTGVYLPDPPPSVSVVKDTPTNLMPREKRLSTLTPLVFAAAFEDNDPLALNILRACAAMLASQIAVLLGESTAVKPQLVKAEECVICFGGSLVGIKEYRTMVLDGLAQRGHIFRYVEFIDDAAAGGAIGLAASYNPGDLA
ncbi:hypothetical protein BDQ12DRAFT_39196 [Crucibulum laeve]|uniref:N-acetyl-D-glucosamine kinase n=1 Tax=Crucibulum laeve TaxID=68775 RepID=A0A5C3MLS2_9AGAR|nr:hypothetical protein BDQ12DRAFT_39196 [Crucibulum laeve]